MGRVITDMVVVWVVVGAGRGEAGGKFPLFSNSVGASLISRLQTLRGYIWWEDLRLFWDCVFGVG